MSFARPHVPLDALMGRLQLPGPLQDVALRAPARADMGNTASFRAQLLQHMMGELDRTSMAMNETEAGTSALPMHWNHLPALGTQDAGPKRARLQGARRATPGTPARHRPQTVAPELAVCHALPAPGVSSTRPALSAPPPALGSESGLARSNPLPAKAVVPQVSAAEGFLKKLAGIAQATAETLGLSPHLLLAQAALETGWGRKAIKDVAGQESYNLFGIKADKHWTGKTVEVRTTEYINGVPQTKVASFRAYDSYADSFADYARLIKHRYGQAIANGATAEGFGQALQARGYATDPNYAQKIARVAQSVAYRMASRPVGTSEMA